MEELEKTYSDESFWEKLRRYAVRAGREVVEKALVLYYCLHDPDTPTRAKTVIIGALAYFILPTDLIPDPTIFGFTDDLGALGVALGLVAVHLKPAHRERARQRADGWFAGIGSESPVEEKSAEP